VKEDAMQAAAIHGGRHSPGQRTEHCPPRRRYGHSTSGAAVSPLQLALDTLQAEGYLRHNQIRRCT
jgi:hypothetical protein